jgi:RecB family exonuclease
MSNEPKTLKLSVSKVKVFQSCKRKFQYSYVLKLPKKEWAHLLYGKILHRILELYHNTIFEGSLLPKNFIMKDSFLKTMEEYKDQITKEVRKDVYELALSYLKSEQQSTSNYDVIGCEKPFEINIENKVILNGAIDRIQVDEDKIIHVIDYKTSKDPKYLQADSFQLETYAYVLSYYQKQKDKWCKTASADIDVVRGSYIMLKHNFKPIDFLIEKKTIDKIPEIFLKYGEAIEAETEYKPTTSPLCNYCDYKNVCSEGSKIRKRKPAGEW